MNNPIHNRETTLVLKNPRITEKASDLSANNVYTFDVDLRANKKEVTDAVKSLYNVTPVKVNVMAVPAKTKRRGRIMGKTSAGKKALVFLKKGDKIEFV